MIPFYIAGTLPKADTTRLENHLTTCAECRKSLEEWRAIATAVRNDAASQMRNLPPLSPQVLSAVKQRPSHGLLSPGSLPLSDPPTTRYRATSLTLIAAVFTVILFGGLLAFMLRGTPPKQGGVVLIPSVTPPVSATAPEDATPSPFPSTETKIAPVTPTDPPQIIVVDPSATPSPSLVFNTPILPTLNFATAIPPKTLAPTTQFIPYSLPTTVTPLVFATDTPQTFAQSMLLGMGGGGEVCMIRAAVPNSAVNLYAGPGTSYPAINTFAGDDELIALGKSDNGWYQAQYTARGNQWVGWVRQEMVYTSGSCDTLPLIPSADYQDGALPTASASAPLVNPPAVTITSEGINLRGGPGTNYPIIGSARLGESYHVEAQASSGGQLWYLLTLSGGRSAWVFSTLVQLSPANAIIAPDATIPPTPMPTASAPPPMPTATLAPNIVAGNWSQTITVLTTTCAGSSGGTSTTMPVTLTVSADSITLSYAEAGTPLILSRSGDRVYSGGYSTANNSVSVILTFTSSTGYAGSANVTQNDGCSTQSAWNGLFQSS